MKKVTLSVGIPAYNEEANIKNVIKSILRQDQKNYILENIFVICDGCTDNTVEIVQELSQKEPVVKLKQRAVRGGKVGALNKIYEVNKSDLILPIDADLVFAKKDDIDEMVKAIISDKNLNFVGPRHIPLKSKTLMGMFAYYSFLSFEDAFLKINNGNCFYAVMGCYLLRKEFSKAIKYPKDAQADQVILYAMATRKTKMNALGHKGGFRFVPSAHVIFRTVTTFYDWRVLGTRSVISDRANAVKYFGESILAEYYMPRNLYIKSLIKYFFKNPFILVGSVLMNIYIRKFPMKKKMPKGGIWETTMSSKEAINI